MIGTWYTSYRILYSIYYDDSICLSVNRGAAEVHRDLLVAFRDVEDLPYKELQEAGLLVIYIYSVCIIYDIK